MNSLYEWLESPFFKFGGFEMTPMSLLKLTVLPILLYLAAKTIRSVSLRRLRKNQRLGPGVADSVATLVYYGILVVGLFSIVSTAGLDFRALAAFTGALGLGVGLGLQEIARNFISGIILLTARPIRTGDRIEVEGLEGDVRQIGFYSTVVVTLDDAAVIVPNSFLLQNKLINWTHTGSRRRIRVPVGVHYDSDPEGVRDVLLAVAAASDDVLKDPAPDVRLVEFGDSSVNFDLLVWTEKFAHLPNVLVSRLNYRIHAALRDASIVIPYPQRDLHLKTSDVSLLGRHDG
ncbi:MAG: mechanosensitive ion channel [Fimbriimonadaceae bacterium]|nr:mechanosensitive ion channel [Chthonomonadaceae bacterium]MCO5296921.1 mechanosensitive ion channel [Fimbriimonadaceae bacterium]